MEDYNPHKNKIHKFLVHSYLAYFVLFLVGVYLDLVFKLKIFTSPAITYTGVFLLIFGSFLIIWAQYTSRNFKKDNASMESFCHGPYCYIRHPTHLGFFLLLLGFGVVADAIFVILLSMVAFFASRLFFLKKEENIMEQKYGAPYFEYKKKVRF